ncbi:MAG: nuclear transport factor 2 family protein [Burkholderiales bacterium]|nr:nuclear transport factor 2 family protein [Burkholderiales bacterium]
MERLFGSDLVYIHSSTVRDDKSSYIESMRSGTVRYRRMQRQDTQVRTFGPVGIVTGQAKFEVTARGQEMVMELLFHAVWVKRASGPQFVSWQATRVPAQ